MAYVSLLISGLLLLLFAISRASGQFAGADLSVSSPFIAIAAGFNALVGSFSLWLGRKQPSVIWPSVTYAVLVVSVGVLIHTTGDLQSPYIASWLLVGVFGGLFGLLGIGATAVFANGYVLFQLFLPENAQLIPQSWLLLLAANLPLIVGYLIWDKTTKNNEAGGANASKATELVNSGDQSEIVINSIADGLIALDTKGVVELINPAAQNILGWAAGDAKGLHHESVLKLLDKRDQPVPLEQSPLEEVKSSKQPVVNNNLTLVGKTGKKMIASLVISPVVVNGQVTNVIVIFRDITAEKAREREQAEFVSTASHEMRTPVAAIEGYLALVANPKTANIDDKARLYLGKAQESVQHLGRLFKDLLTVSRADDGRMENHPQVTDIVAFVGNVTESLQAKAAEKNLELQFKPYIAAQNAEAYTTHSNVTPIFYANVDRDHLREVSANLVENAIKYTKKGKVTVDVTGDDTTINVGIEDSGIGIPAEDIQHLFQKFYRVDSSDTREIGGTGLGLYISRRLIEAMAGKLWVESELGKGSTFYISLPRISNKEIKELQQSEAIETLQRKKAAAAIAKSAPANTSSQPAPQKPTPNPSTASPAAEQPSSKPVNGAASTSSRPATAVNTQPNTSASKPAPITTQPQNQTAQPSDLDSEPGPIPGAPEIKNPKRENKPTSMTTSPEESGATKTISDISQPPTTPQNLRPLAVNRERGGLSIPGRPITTRDNKNAPL